MNISPKYVKVPCGGRIREREADAHRTRCELCKAMMEYNQENFNYGANIVLIILAIVFVAGIVWLTLL